MKTTNQKRKTIHVSPRAYTLIKDFCDAQSASISKWSERSLLEHIDELTDDEKLHKMYRKQSDHEKLSELYDRLYMKLYGHYGNCEKELEQEDGIIIKNNWNQIKKNRQQ